MAIVRVQCVHLAPRHILLVRVDVRDLGRPQADPFVAEVVGNAEAEVFALDRAARPTQVPHALVEAHVLVA